MHNKPFYLPLFVIRTDRQTSIHTVDLQTDIHTDSITYLQTDRHTDMIPKIGLGLTKPKNDGGRTFS